MFATTRVPFSSKRKTRHEELGLVGVFLENLEFSIVIFSAFMQINVPY